MSDKNILVFINNYLPSYKSGGPVRSISNLIESLPEYFSFDVVCNDRDAGDLEPFNCACIDGYVTLAKERVLYLPSRFLDAFFMLRKNLSHKYDVVYLSSFFNFKFSFIPFFLILFGVIYANKIIISPRGELMAGALEIGRYKKNIYILFMKMLFKFKSPSFHSTSTDETASIKRFFPHYSIHEVTNLPRTFSCINDSDVIDYSQKSILRFVYISRVTEKKNLRFFIESLVRTNTNIAFILDIYGPANGKDFKYLESILKIDFGDNFTVNYNGPINNDEVLEILPNYDYFVLPTKGENFGHAIVESLLSGVPVIISKFTPFSDVEDFGSGFVIDISNLDSITLKFDEISSFHKNPYAIQRYVENKLNSKSVIKQYVELFSAL